MNDGEDENLNDRSEAYQLALEEYYERQREMREDWEYEEELRKKRPDGPWADLMRRVGRLI